MIMDMPVQSVCKEPGTYQGRAGWNYPECEISEIELESMDEERAGIRRQDRDSGVSK